MSQKKPKCLTLYEKALIIQELKSGSSVTNLSKKYDVAKSTICKIKNNKELILRAVTSTYTGPGQRRTLRGSKQPEMEKQLYKWFLNNRNNNVTISADMIKEKAKALHLDIEKNKDFSASDGWLQRFKKRFGIRYLKITGKNLSSQSEIVDPFREQLKKNIEQLGLTLDELCNADDSTLYCKLRSKKTKKIDSNDQEKEDDLPIAVLEKKSKENQTEAMTEERDILNMLIPQIELNESDVSKCNEVDYKTERSDQDRNKEKTESETKEGKSQKKVTLDNAINALNTSIQWAEESGVHYIYIQLLKEMREGALMQKMKKP